MDDEFLYRLRETPSHDFAVALKAKLDRQSAKSFGPVPTWVRNLAIALLFGGAALAAATVAMKGGVRAVYGELVALHAASTGVPARASATGPRASTEQVPASSASAELREVQTTARAPVSRSVAPNTVETHTGESPSGFMARVEERQSPAWSGDRATLLDVMQKYRVPGVSVAVIKDFEVHWAKGYGVADVVTRQPVDGDTLFQAGGLSQLGTALAVLKAAQEGRLSLDADVNEMLKSWKVPKSKLTATMPVTLRALLSHTSGADDGQRYPGYDPGKPLPTLVQMLEGEQPSNVGPVHFAWPPLMSYRYTHGGPTIVQLAMTDALGTPFATIMQTYLLVPLGMQDSTYEQPIPEALEARTARGHDFEGIEMRDKWRVYPQQAAAGLWSTAGDLAQLAIEIQRALNGSAGRVLSMEMAREMVTPVGVGPFALGFVPRGGGAYVEHDGFTQGFHSFLFVHRDGYGLIVMTNGDNGRKVRDEIAARVAAAYAWEPLEKGR